MYRGVVWASDHRQLTRYGNRDERIIADALIEGIFTPL